MNVKFNKNAKVGQLTKVVLSHGEEKGLIVKDPSTQYTCIKSIRSQSHPTLIKSIKSRAVGLVQQSVGHSKHSPSNLALPVKFRAVGLGDILFHAFVDCYMYICKCSIIVIAINSLLKRFWQSFFFFFCKHDFTAVSR